MVSQDVKHVGKHVGRPDDGVEFGLFRNRVVELIKDVVFVVGSANVFAHMFDVLTNQSSSGNKSSTTTVGSEGGSSSSWESMEAALFVMCSVARNLHPTDQEESSCVPQIVEAVLGKRERISTQNEGRLGRG